MSATGPKDILTVCYIIIGFYHKNFIIASIYDKLQRIELGVSKWTNINTVMGRHLEAVGGRPPRYAAPPCDKTLDILTFKVVSESRVTWATSVPILVFLGLSVLDLGLMYATDRRQTDVR